MAGAPTPRSAFDSVPSKAFAVAATSGSIVGRFQRLRSLTERVVDCGQHDQKLLVPLYGPAILSARFTMTSFCAANSTFENDDLLKMSVVWDAESVCVKPRAISAIR